MRHKRQQGVALVVTLILLSVITFTAITFLIVSRREKGAVATSTDQTIAKLAAETGMERAQAEIFSTIMVTTNKFNYDLKVTTNYFNRLGFTPQGNDTDPVLTNVNYEFLVDGTIPTRYRDRNQNIANLFYSPRVPVYVDTNQAGVVPVPPLDFRFYLDLNRNGFFDASGLQPVVGPGGGYLDTNGLQAGPLFPAPPDLGGLYQSNYVTGDPQWIGILERPDEPHGPDNRFVARYATVVVPSGKTLDLNRVHNQAALGGPAANARYRRNMGVGTWEMNLASFLVDLNTNLWFAPDDTRANNYSYDPFAGSAGSVEGLAFRDAEDIVSYRYDPELQFQLRPWFRLRAYDVALGSQSQLPFETDLIDGFGAGPNYLTNLWPTIDDDVTKAGQPGWPGDDNPQHYFAPGDLFDENKVGPAFASRLSFDLDRIQLNSSSSSTYNRYTFYRLLSQLGTDGGRERSDKVNINYDNRNPYIDGLPNPNGVASETNFVSWRPGDFFMEAADNLLREYHLDHFQRVFGTNYIRTNELNLARNIPVMTNGVFVYTPSINRLLQLAANIYDATTNRATSNTPDFPTVFRPIFSVVLPNNLYITDWQVLEHTNTAGVDDALRQRLVDPFAPNGINEIEGLGGNANVYGVPWIIGAKKGFPNFNELAVDNVFEVTRKLQIRKPSLTADPNQTNQMYLISINSAVGVEAWNSYREAFPYPVTVYATNEMDVFVYVTNQPSRSGGWRAYRSRTER